MAPACCQPSLPAGQLLAAAGGCWGLGDAAHACRPAAPCARVQACACVCMCARACAAVGRHMHVPAGACRWVHKRVQARESVSAHERVRRQVCACTCVHARALLCIPLCTPARLKCVGKAGAVGSRILAHTHGPGCACRPHSRTPLSQLPRSQLPAPNLHFPPSRCPTGGESSRPGGGTRRGWGPSATLDGQEGPRRTRSGCCHGTSSSFRWVETLPRARR